MCGLVVAPSGGVALSGKAKLFTPFELRGVELDNDVLPFLFLNIANRSEVADMPKVWAFYRRRVGPKK